MTQQTPQSNTADQATAGTADAPKPDAVQVVLKTIERGFLALVVLMTIAAAAIKITGLVAAMTVNLGDILLMFLYAEIVAMVLVFYTGKGSPYVFPIFIAMTALARLIVLQGKDMDPQNILVEAAAILLLAIAAWIVLKLPYGDKTNT
jgi:protein PsiE